MFWAFIFGVILVLGLSWVSRRYVGFTAQTPADYTQSATDFDIRKALDGEVLCEGIIYGPLGRVSSRFVAKMNAKWEGDVGVITEEFTYDTGATQSREWQLEMQENGEFDATAADIVGTGKGTQAGSGVLLNYTIQLPENAGSHVLNVTDWMYLLSNGTIMNKSEMRKFGFKVAELVATMRKVA